MKHNLFTALTILIAILLLVPGGVRPSALAQTGTAPAGPAIQAAGGDLLNQQGPEEPPEPGRKIFIPLSPYKVWAGETYAVSGRIVDGEDQPVPGVTVSTDRGQSALTDEDGRYTLQVPPTPDLGDQFLRAPETVFSLLDEVTGLTQITAAKEGFACTPLTIRINVPPAVTNQNFTCSSDVHNLSGQIVDLEGNPVAGIQVTDNAGRSATTGADGTFTIFDVPAGIYTLMPNGKDHVFTPSARTIRVGSSRVRALLTADLTFIALASPWAPQHLGVSANLGDPAGFAYTTNRSMAIDSGGNPHVVFGGGANGLFHATYDGTLWTVTQIDATANAFYASIAMDKNDRPHIAYFIQFPALPDIDFLKYVRGNWEGGMLVFGTPQTIDFGRKIAVGTSIAIDGNNRPHIAYYDDERDQLKYAHSPSGSNWLDEVVDNSGNVGWAPSIAINTAGEPRISYYDFTDQEHGELKYAYKSGANWFKMTVAAKVLSMQAMQQIKAASPVDINAILAGFGLFSSLVVDSAGYPHIAYFDDYADNLMHAYFSPSGWRYEVVDHYQAVGGFASLRLDRRDRPHIGYYDSTNGNLKYALGTGSDWKIMIVDNLGDVGALSSIALDSAGNPHFYYYDALSNDMKYARRVIWEQQTIGLIGTLLEPGNRNLKLDSDGQPHIAFGGSNLYHGFFDGSVWQFELVDPSPDVGEFASLAIDANDNIHISYYDTGNGFLRYAYYNRLAGTWTIEIIDAANKVGRFTSITLDSNGRPHVAYLDEYLDRLKYAYKSGSTWRREVVDDDGNVGAYPSIALDSNNVPHIGYYDFTVLNGDVQANDLKYARRLGNDNWVTEIVDGSGKNGLFTSLAIDSSNRPHIAYFNDDNDDLKYAYKSSGTWYISTIDTVNSVGWYITMALDSYDNAHISYYDYSNGNLKYATSKWNRWNIEVIDDVGDVGMYSSITLDKADRPYFLYYDATNNQLKYARLNMWDVVSIPLVSALVEPGRPNLGIGPSGLPHVAYGGTQLNYAYFDGTNWLTYALDSTNASMGWYASLAVNQEPNVAVYISYYDALNGDLRFTWAHEDGVARGYSGLPHDLLDSAGDVGKFTSIALDGANRPHIAYFDETNDDLKYAFWTGSGWAVEVVDSQGNVGPYPYLALDPWNRPAIAYYDITKRDLLFAHRLGNHNWNVINVHSKGNVGLFASLAFDSFGNPHIAYFDDDFDDLRYAYRASNGVWHYSVIDTRGSTGWFISLDIDSNNNPHISYYDYSNGNLKHAFKYRGKWVIELLDAPGNTGLYTSLQIGNADSAHILYYDADLNVLRFARAVDWR